jgi:hypothetical protein
LNVNVTRCEPWPLEESCNQHVCGPVPDGCGGSASCGECGADAPYCYQGLCITCPPIVCGYRQGFDPQLCICQSCEGVSKDNTCDP